MRRRIGTEAERTAHLDWCKRRALEYLDRGDIAQAIASFSSDIRKSPTTADITDSPIFPVMMFASVSSIHDARSFIVGWN